MWILIVFLVFWKSVLSFISESVNNVQFLSLVIFLLSPIHLNFTLSWIYLPLRFHVVKPRSISTAYTVLYIITYTYSVYLSCLRKLKLFLILDKSSSYTGSTLNFWFFWWKLGAFPVSVLLILMMLLVTMLWLACIVFSAYLTA